MSSDLLKFYRGRGIDAAGRTIDEVWAFERGRLEAVHDYIQWIFPLPDPSRFNPDAPLLSAADIAAFRSDAALCERALRSLDVMLAFLGLVRRAQAIERAPAFSADMHWLQPLNHNHLRLTRMMLFLRHVGLATEAEAFLACVLDIAAREGKSTISDATLRFWQATRSV